jgi:hypothetical protein
MTERPIIFNDEMVRAILDGKKTQTRRVIKPQPSKRSNHIWANENQFAFCEWTHDKGAKCEEDSVIKSPYGVPGDRLWVREVFALESSQEVSYDPPHKDGRPLLEVDGGFEHGTWWEQPHYQATDEIPDLCYDDKDEPFCRWSSPIYMPRWASRILLEIEEVRVERVQDISTPDSKAEAPPCPDGWPNYPSNPIIAFMFLWAAINEGKPGRGWHDNPWVWVITFKVVK